MYVLVEKNERGGRDPQVDEAIVKFGKETWGNRTYGERLWWVFDTKAKAESFATRWDEFVSKSTGWWLVEFPPNTPDSHVEGAIDDAVKRWLTPVVPNGDD